MISIRKIIPILFLIALLFIHWPSEAQQKRGKSNLKPYGEALKRAKKGDVEAILTIADVCRGHMLDPHEVKDYKNALKYYQLVFKFSPNEGQMARTHFGLFILYLNGGYGMLPDVVKARQHLETSLSINPQPLYYTFQPHLYLADFFNLYDNVEQAAPEQRLLLARMFFEYALSYDKAAAQLSPLMAANHPDALYYEEKWRATQARFREGRREMQPEKTTHFKIMERHQSSGSEVARLERIYEAENAQQAYYKPKPEEILSSLAAFQSKDPAMQLRAMQMMQRYQQGSQRFITLRKMSLLKHNLSGEALSFAEASLKEASDFARQVASIEGLAQAVQLYKMNDIAVDAEALKNAFNGSIKPLSDLQKELQKPLVGELVGEAQQRAYAQEMEAQLMRVFRRAESPRKLVDFQKALENETWLQPLAAKYYPLMAESLARLGIDSSNIVFYYESSLLDEMRFKSFEEGKRYVQDLHARLPKPVALPRIIKKPEERLQAELNEKLIREQTRLISAAKYKIIADVVGKDPTKEQIEAYYDRVRTDGWFGQEGFDKYFEYTSNSKNWFSGEVRRNNILYYYKVMRITGTDRYKLEVFSVTANSNLVFNATVKVFENKNDRSFDVHVYNARPVGYSWAHSDQHYLKATYKADGERIEFIPVGNLSQFHDRNHGYPVETLYRKVTPGDFSEKTAIRSAVQFFILEYNRALKTT